MTDVLVSDVWEEVLSYLTYYDVKRIQRVCRALMCITTGFHFGENAAEWVMSVRANTDAGFSLCFFEKIRTDPFHPRQERALTDTLVIRYRHAGRSCSLSLPPVLAPSKHPGQGTMDMAPYVYLRGLLWIEREALYHHNDEYVRCACGTTYSVDRGRAVVKCPTCRCTSCSNPRATWCTKDRCAKCCTDSGCLGHVRRPNAAGVKGRRSELRWVVGVVPELMSA
jgi:hypothetical protein